MMGKMNEMAGLTGLNGSTGLKRTRQLRTLVAAGAVLAMVLGTTTVTQAEENQFIRDFGMGMGAAGANLLYIPAKVVYATLGGITGGFAYGLTGANIEVARKIWTPSMGGTYVVTPTILRGEERLMFSGTTEPKSTAVASSSEQRIVSSQTESAPPPLVEPGSNASFKGY